MGDVAVGNGTGARHAVDGRIRIRMREQVALAVLARVDLECDAIARSHEVAVHEIAVQAELLGFGIADAAAELSGQPFLDVVIDVHQIRAARNRLGFEFHLLDIG